MNSAGDGTPIVGWTRMADGTAADHRQLDAQYRAHATTALVEHLLATFGRLEGPTLGYRIDRARHSRQSATRALRNGERTDLIVAALLHDIGDIVAPDNHSEVAAAIVEPYVDEEAAWIVRHHGVFQGYYYFHHLGGDRDARRHFADSPFYDRCVDFCESYDQNCFDPGYDDLPLDDFVPILTEVFSRPSRLAMGRVRRSR